jgi:hypothetical protein
MGGNNSKPAPRKSQWQIDEENRENRLRSENDQLSRQVNDLRNRFNNYTNDNNRLNIDIGVKNSQLNRDSDNNNRTLNNLKGVSTAWTNDNNFHKNTKIPNEQKIISADETALTNNRGATIRTIYYYLKTMLRAIYSKKQYYDSVKSENDVIISKMSNIHIKSSGDDQTLEDIQTQMRDLSLINTILFILYYLLFIYFSVLLFLNKSVSMFQKIMFFVLLLIYPFYIIKVQKILYSFFMYIYTYWNTVYSIETAE